MHLDNIRKQEIFARYGTSAKDTGSVESQAALFTYHTQHLMGHPKENKKNFSTSRSLRILVGEHRRLLDYPTRRDIERCRKLIAELGIRRTTKF